MNHHVPLHHHHRHHHNHQLTSTQFPPDAIKKSYFSPTSTSTHCPYKGNAKYYTVTTNKTEVKDAAWYYPEPLESMNKIKGYVAFYKGKAEVKSD